ncbi:dimer-Tnp-hAT domain-containing protein [Favolaschia claudopus]|uniref:Dimer-Tnp-hAT domain-containing protein n=1 Tax=Favolaschia claudopus TaxID=2862362 RepID=A0AAW0AQU3_9AGAR
MSRTPFHDLTNTPCTPPITPPPSASHSPAFNAQFNAQNFFLSNENSRDTPATIEPPRKRRKVASEEPFSTKTDAEVWSPSDEKIVENQFARCTSTAWSHYRITIKRQAGVITFVFRCKRGNSKHAETTRERSKMKQGCSSLGDAAKRCDKTTSSPVDNVVTIPYSEARRRAICAIRCAANKPPFASQDDKWYRYEVDLLRPGTIPPSSKVVECDVGLMYVQYAKVVRWYFEICILTMDGAGNCNTTATNLVSLNPRFKGTPWRGYCFLHIIQLSAKMILSFFTKQDPKEAYTSAEEDADLTQLFEEDTAEREAIRNQIPDSTAREEHDKAVVSKIRLAAITAMAERGVTVDAKDSKTALQLIPRVCGLARKIHDSSPVATSFAKIVDNDPTIVGQTQTLARRCASRWNSDYYSRDTALILEQPVRALMKDKDLNLTYKLTNDQWNLAADLRDVLECVKEPTLQFSKGGNARPLISDVITALDSLRNSLINASNSDDIADICRVAAYSRSLVLNKYIDLIPNCEAYEFAIVLFPHLTLDWFKQNGRSSTQIQRIRESIVARFEELFKTTSQPSPARPSAPQPQAPPPGRVRRRFAAPIGRPTPSAPKQIPNDIHSYLDTPPLPSLEGKTVLQYWSAEKATQPDLAEMALTYCSAPSTSVDVFRRP